MITVEKTSRILNDFNIAFTEGAVLGYLQRGLFNSAHRIKDGYYSRNTKYNFAVDKDSLVKFLLGRGASEEEINVVISE
ncbi:hypothetical protein ACIQ4I_19945 [Rummeliibacillus sp. NPDC094406]|uniref:hypothetical protein n=1 Tax=Rummeliibacillus sp. NPDC094406 TaxID=3364511 RepID=UPI0037FBCC94